jgi:hypothetical protein
MSTKKVSTVVLPGDHLYEDDCKVETFTFGDASALSLLIKAPDIKKLVEVLDSRTNLDATKLTIQDFKFLLYWHRINSYANFPNKIIWHCPHCETKNYHNLTADKLIIKDLDPIYDHGLVIDLPDAGPTALRIKLVEDELKARKWFRENKKEFDEETLEKLMYAGMLELEGGTLSERLEKIENMSSDDFCQLIDFQNEFDYGIQEYSEFACTNDECKEVAKVNHNFDLVSFFPQVQGSGNVRARILSGQRAAPANRESSTDGLGQGDLHKGQPHKGTKKTGKRKEGQDEQSNQTIENLQRQLQEELAKVSQSSLSRMEDEEHLDYEELMKNR